MKIIIEYLKNLFKKDPYNIIKKETINYKYIKSKDITVSTIMPDIKSYNKHLKKVLENDIFNSIEYKNIKQVSENKLYYSKLLYFCSDNGKMLSNVDIEVKEFFLLTDKLILEFNRLKKYKSDVIDYKFNIRLLQPYIINIESIRRCFI